MRRWALLLGLFVFVTAACSGDGDAAGSFSTPTTAPPDEAAVCAANDDLDEVHRSLASPDVFELSEEDLQEAFAKRHAAIETVTEAAESDREVAALEELDANYRIVEPAYVEALTERGEVVEELGVFWAVEVFRSSAVTVRESEAFFDARSGDWPLYKVAAQCTNPDLLGLPTEDLDGEVEAGTIVFDRLGGEDTGLWAVPSSGGDPVSIPPPAGWDDVDEPTTAPDGRTMVAVVRRGGESPAIGLATGTVGAGFTVQYETSDAELACPRIDASGVILATRFGIGDEPNLLLTVDGEDVSTVEMPARDFYCAERTSDGELYLGSASEDAQEVGGFARVTDDGTSLIRLYGDEDCNGVPSGLSPDERFELVVESCYSPAESGVVAVDLESGEAETIMQWTSALARWSPSGEWITFGLSPADRPWGEGTSVWLMRRDGSGLRRLLDEPSSWSTWVSDELQ